MRRYLDGPLNECFLLLLMCGGQSYCPALVPYCCSALPAEEMLQELWMFQCMLVFYGTHSANGPQQALPAAQLGSCWEQDGGETRSTVLCQ